MAARVYAAPKDIPAPDLSILVKQGNQAYFKACDEYKTKLAEFCRARSKGAEVGEVIKFQVADGYAQYMVYSMRPLSLLHLQLVDGYQFQYAHLLTATEVRKEIARGKAIAQLFNRRG